MAIEKHVLTEPVVIFGWNNICTEHSRFCKEDACTHAYFNGTDLVIDILEEKSSEGTSYRMLAPTPQFNLITTDEIKKMAEENGLIFVHEIVDALRKGYHNEWISEVCKQNDITGYLPYVFYNNGLLELHIAEFKTPSGKRKFVMLPH
ncbi:MAG: hypothetical protein IJX99_02385 [Clostridia bacterium]|nr:hypothetical protein [Clostridia bacterium]